MRSGKFTCPSMEAYTPKILSSADVAVDSHSAPSRMTVQMKRSKTDPFGVGMVLYLGHRGDILCLVTSKLAYLAVWPSSPGPLFVLHNGTPLSRTRLIQSLQQALRDAGLDDSRFSSHSFHFGAATKAASSLTCSNHFLLMSIFQCQRSTILSQQWLHIKGPTYSFLDKWNKPLLIIVSILQPLALLTVQILSFINCLLLNI